VKLAHGADDAEAKAEDILGLDINGHIVRKVWIERASDISKEYYLSITFDRGAKKPLYILTTEGGIEIEQVAEENPDALARLHVDVLEGFQPYQARRLVYGAGIDDPNEQKQILGIVEKLYRCFVESDAMLTEINPLIVTPDGDVRALDSKFTVDESALFRHPDIAEMRDVEAADPQERLARGERRHVREAGRERRHPRERRRSLDVHRRRSWSSPAGGPRTSATSAAAETRRASSMRSR
jgi:succinyl-CoA synthetase beta subunit